MPPIPPQTVVARKPVHASRVKDDLVIFDERAGRYFATGSVGADIWELIETPRSLQHICEQLIQRYDVAAETCLAEVQGFLGELSAAGLVEFR